MLWPNFFETFYIFTVYADLFYTPCDKPLNLQVARLFLIFSF